MALDILNEGTRLRPEDAPGGEGATGPAGGDARDSAAAHGSPSPPPPVPAGVAAGSGPERRERARRRLAGSPACGEDPGCRGDPEKGLRENERPLALAVPARSGARHPSGSRTHLEDWPAPNQRMRRSPRQPRGRQAGPLLSEGSGGNGDEDSPSRGAAPSSVPRAGERGLRARACPQAWPGDSAPVRPARPDARGPPAKQLCSAGGQGSGPRGQMTLRSTARPGVPADGSRLCDPDEGKAARPPHAGQGGAPAALGQGLAVRHRRSGCVPAAPSLVSLAAPAPGRDLPLPASASQPRREGVPRASPHPACLPLRVLQGHVPARAGRPASLWDPGLLSGPWDPVTSFLPGPVTESHVTFCRQLVVRRVSGASPRPPRSPCPGGRGRGRGAPKDPPVPR